MTALTRRFASLRVRLLLLVLVALVPAVGLSLYAVLEQRQLSTLAVQETALRLARLASSDQGRLVTSTRQLLIGLARLPEVRARDGQRCGALFAELLAQYPLYANLGAIDGEGRLFCSGLPARAPINLADRAYFQRALKTRDFAVGEFQVGRATGKATINVGYPVVQDSGGLQGVVFAALDLAWLNQFVGEAQLPSGSTLTILDQKGTILVRHPESTKWVGRPAGDTTWAKTILKQRVGVAEAVEPDDVARLVGFSPLLDREGGDVYVSIGIPTAVAFAEANRSLLRNVFAIAVVVAVALFAAYLWANTFVLRPVNALVAATRRVAGGDLSARTGLSSSLSELGQLARAFDEMAEALQRNLAQLVRQEKLAELGRLAAGVAHELRNPLTVLDGRLHLLLTRTTAGELPPADVLARQVTSLKDATERMKRIMQGLSTYSKPSKPEPTLLDVGELLAATRELVAHQAKTAGVSMAVEVAGPVPAVSGDRSQMMQVLVNLAVNGIEAMVEGGGRLTLRAGTLPSPGPDAERAGQPGVVIEVRDTGPGIPAEALSRIWEVFYTTKSEGTGLGLSIVRGLVEQQPGAAISLDSTPGVGTAFRLTMPAAARGPEMVPGPELPVSDR